MKAIHSVITALLSFIYIQVWQKLCELHKAQEYTGRPTEKYFKYEGKI